MQFIILYRYRLSWTIVIITLRIKVAAEILHVLPNNPTNVSCPSQPCATLSQYLLDNNGTLPVASNVEYHFLPGEHHINNTTILHNLSNFSFSGISNKFVGLICCSKLYIYNSKNVTITSIDFMQCAIPENQIYEDEFNFIMLSSCSYCKLENAIFISYGIKAYNIFGQSHLSNIRIFTIASRKNELHYGVSLKYNKWPQNNYTINTFIINNISIAGEGSAGIEIWLHQTDYNINIIISDSYFTRMDQQVLVAYSDAKSTRNTLLIANCTFKLNSGFAIELESMISITMSNFNMLIIIGNCSFYTMITVGSL